MLKGQGLARLTRRVRIIASQLLPANSTSSSPASATGIAAAAQLSTASMAAREVAVVGGGISGLYCASVLSKHGHKVTVFDLGKHAPGGRLTTRKTSWKGLQFDHGCQFIRPVSETFRAICEDWREAGAVVPWEGNVVRYECKTGSITPRQQYHQQQQNSPDYGFLNVLGPGPLYVGYPSSDAVTKHLADSLTSSGSVVRNDVKVAKAAFDASTSKWVLEGAVRTPVSHIRDIKAQPPITPWNLGVFDALVLADKMTGCPGTPGFVDISGTTAGTKMLQAMSEVGSTPLLALLIGYQPQEIPMEQQAAAAAAAAEQDQQQQQAGPRARPVLSLPFDAAAVASSVEISWVSCDNTKPGRGRADGIQTLVALATPAFSESLIQRNPDGSLPPQTPELLSKMVPPMFAALQRVLAPLLVQEQGRLHEPAFVQVHRWGSALPANPFGSPCLTAESALLAACGDFCLGAGVENAVLSGKAAAEAINTLLAAS